MTSQAHVHFAQNALWPHTHTHTPTSMAYSLQVTVYQGTETWASLAAVL